MGTLALLWLLALASLACGKALLDLTGVQEIEGTWRASVNLPCVYEPSPDFEQGAVLWKASLPDHSASTIFRRTPDSGDQTLLVRFRSRIHVPKDPPGDVSLLIEDLEMADHGQYTCQVVWVARNKSSIIKERITVLSVVKVAVTKPVITAGRVVGSSTLPRGRNISLTCQASGSPPITYRWFKAAQKGNIDRFGENAVLHFDSLQLSDTGTYFCEVQNRVSSTVQRSAAFQLTVKDPSELPALRSNSENVDGTIAERAPQRTSLPLYAIALIAVLCAVALLVVLAVAFCRRKPRADHTYEVSYNNPMAALREEASPAVSGAYRCEAEQVTHRVENNYTMEPARIPEDVPMDTEMNSDYETLVYKMESEYEVVDALKGAGMATWRPSQ